MQIDNSVFIEYGVNRALKTKCAKLIHLNNVQQNLDPAFLSGLVPDVIGNTQIDDVWPDAADVFQYYEDVNSVDKKFEQTNLISASENRVNEDRRERMLEMCARGFPL